MERHFSVAGCTALVTGANQGIGHGFVVELLASGAARVYATARRPETLPDLEAIDTERVRVLPLDVCDEEQRLAAVDAAGDVTLLVNNAGIPGSRNAQERLMLAAPSLADARLIMETDCWAPVELCRLFAPLIIRNGGGAICNIISVGALFCLPEFTSYSMAKAAFAAATAGIRAELDREPVLVASVFTGGVRTRMTAKGLDPKTTPRAHAREVLAALAEGSEDIYPGDGAAVLRDRVRADPKAFERELIERFQRNPLRIE